MAKISVAMGPSDATTGEGMPTPKELRETEAVVVEDAIEDVPGEAAEGDEVEEVDDEPTKAELQDAAQSRGLPKSGTKAELAERIAQHDAEEPAEGEPVF